MMPHVRLGLEVASDPRWVAAACADSASLLADHANCEKKAAATAMSLMSRHPDDGRLVHSMLHLAQEELRHFERVFELMRYRKLDLVRDEPDEYVRQLLALCRSQMPDNLVDRLLALSFVEARSCERFLLLAEHHLDPELAALYADLARSEEGHSHLFVSLAERYRDPALVAGRRRQMARDEAEIVARLPHVARIHG